MFSAPFNFIAFVVLFTCCMSKVQFTQTIDIFLKMVTFSTLFSPCVVKISSVNTLIIANIFKYRGCLYKATCCTNTDFRSFSLSYLCYISYVEIIVLSSNLTQHLKWNFKLLWYTKGVLKWHVHYSCGHFTLFFTFKAEFAVIDLKTSVCCPWTHADSVGD